MELQEALDVMYEILRVNPNENMLMVYKAAQAYADLPAKIEWKKHNIEQCSRGMPEEAILIIDAYDDILNLIKEQQE